MDREVPTPAPVAGIWAAYKAAQPERGIALGRAAAISHPEHGEVWYALACCLERAGDMLEADRCFGRAARCRDEPQERPFRVPWQRFERLVAEAREALPEKLRRALDEVTLVLADYAEPELIDHHEDAELLGLFVGHSRAERLSPPPGSLSPRIFVFRRAHEHATISAVEFADEVRQTLWHELGHYIGYDEDGLEDLGMD
jgi:predicted Zn-dependent protease with MMP-like domain